MSPKTLLSGRRPRGFTLVEILVVLAIISVIMFFAMPNLQQVVKGSKLVQAGEQLRGDLALAVQTAAKDSIPIEIRFYRYNDPELTISSNGKLFTAYGIYRLLPDLDKPSDPTAPRILDPLIKIKKLPAGVGIPEDALLSPLVANENIPTASEEVRGLIPTQRRTEAIYRAFQLTTDGGTNLDKSGRQQWYVTLVDTDEIERNGGSVNNLTPKNYVTLQIDPFNASIRWFQPN